MRTTGVENIRDVIPYPRTPACMDMGLHIQSGYSVYWVELLPSSFLAEGILDMQSSESILQLPRERKKSPACAGLAHHPFVETAPRPVSASCWCLEQVSGFVFLALPFDEVIRVCRCDHSAQSLPP